MAKKITGYIKLTIPACKANPSPPIGPALGSKGLNIMEFCKAFNAKTQDKEPGTPTPVVITVFEDKSFTFITKLPPVSHLIKKIVKIDKGSTAPKKTTPPAEITLEQCRQIAAVKIEDMNANDIESATKMVQGSALSMGITVTN